MKNIVIGVIALLIIGGLAFVFLSDKADAPTVEDTPDVSMEDRMPVEPDGGIGDGAQPLDELLENPSEVSEVIGTSANGVDIVANHFGTGATEVLFVGGIHSGFAPSTVAVAEGLLAALEDGDVTVPEGLRVTVITNLNPDAPKNANTLAGRLNANGVDLNRNFNCEWEAEGTWRSTAVSGGSAAGSEPETKAIETYVANNNVAGAVVYYAADGGVYASNCGGGGLDPKIATLTGLYADAAGYTANEEFDAYKISGDMTNWLAKEGIPAIGVLLTDYTNGEWAKNKAGVEAVLNFYAQ